ncbi:MAG: hypothetical protein ACXVZR_03755 [Terriglobales bacterium]
MNARKAVLMLSSVVVASLILKACPKLKAFVAAHSITVKDTSGRALYDAI